MSRKNDKTKEFRAFIIKKKDEKEKKALVSLEKKNKKRELGKRRDFNLSNLHKTKSSLLNGKREREKSFCF